MEEVWSILLSILVFILYMLAGALYKYFKANNCIPNVQDIDNLRNEVHEIMELGLAHDKTIKDLKSYADSTNLRRNSI